VVAHEDHTGVLRLPGFFEHLQHVATAVSACSIIA
jgi:hypothetical protein